LNLEVEAEAFDLRLIHPENSWAEAMSRARAAQRRGDQNGKQLWTAVAFRLVEIEAAIRVRQESE
jgi:hypothetical protein